MRVLSFVILHTLTEDPTLSLTGLATKLSSIYDRRVTRPVLGRVLKQLRWSWRIPSHVQIHKFRDDNLERYAHHVAAIQHIPWDRLKFLDECHVVPRKLRKRKVLGLIGQRTWIKVRDLHQKSFSITLMTQLDETRPLVFDIREESNTQWDFLEFVNACVEHGQLQAGDYLILDNASIHGGLDSIDELLQELQKHGVTLAYLPAYSPELNPCEPVFLILKAHLRNHRDTTIPICLDVVRGLAKVTYSKLLAFYDKCIYYENVCNTVL